MEAGGELEVSGVATGIHGISMACWVRSCNPCCYWIFTMIELSWCLKQVPFAEQPNVDIELFVGRWHPCYRVDRKDSMEIIWLVLGFLIKYLQTVFTGELSLGNKWLILVG